MAERQLVVSLFRALYRSARTVEATAPRCEMTRRNAADMVLRGTLAPEALRSQAAVVQRASIACAERGPRAAVRAAFDAGAGDAAPLRVAAPAAPAAGKFDDRGATADVAALGGDDRALPITLAVVAVTSRGARASRASSRGRRGPVPRGARVARAAARRRLADAPAPGAPDVGAAYEGDFLAEYGAHGKELVTLSLEDGVLAGAKVSATTTPPLARRRRATPRRRSGPRGASASPGRASNPTWRDVDAVAVSRDELVSKSRTEPVSLVLRWRGPGVGRRGVAPVASDVATAPPPGEAVDLLRVSDCANTSHLWRVSFYVTLVAEASRDAVVWALGMPAHAPRAPRPTGRTRSSCAGRRSWRATTTSRPRSPGARGGALATLRCAAALRQCRSGDTSGGRWVARPAARGVRRVHRRPEALFAGLSGLDAVDANAELAERAAAREKAALRAANGGDRWRFVAPTCAYHYFEDAAALASALAKKTGAVLFAAVRAGYLQMWSADQFRELVAPRVRSTWARARAAGAAVVVVVNFGAAHAVDGACDGTLLALARSVVAELAAGLAGVRVRFVFASLTRARPPRANFRTGKSLETLSIARRLARELPDNATGEALDLTNVTAARQPGRSPCTVAQSAASELPWCDLCGGGDSSGPERVYAKSSQAPADIDDAPVVMADNTRADSGERVELEPMSADVKIERKVTAGFPALGIKPIHIGNECRGKKMCRWRPYEHIHAKYDTHPDLVDLYAVPPSEEKTKWPFNSMMRTKLIWDILHSRYKNYFGEMHGMRMAFTAHITSAYYILAAVGFAILVETLVAGTEATKAVISYTFFLVIWSIVVSEKWKTRQCALSVTWGTRGFEENEKPRPQYTGYMVASPITGKPEVFFPPHERKPSIVANVFVVLFMILLNLAFLGVVFYLKAARPGFLGSIDFQLFSYFVSFVNAFGIQFFYFLFKAVAVQLNDRENWRTETQYHDYLTSKMFYFYIVNYYAPLYYLTFIQYYANPFTTNQKARGDDNGYDTVAEQVFGELRTTVIVILGVALVSQNASRVLMPLLKEYWQKSSEGGIDTEMSVPELQYVLFEYDEVLDTTYDYMLITMQYGYVILFSAAFPAPSAR
ncbi:intracellular chloride channel [Aureococcus anophagefferens]|nr:intracellular chloride channel [Aureococcus anophagefferens]